MHHFCHGNYPVQASALCGKCEVAGECQLDSYLIQVRDQVVNKMQLRSGRSLLGGC